ncbi:MAG: ABC transporter permease [Acidobacteria bacterium]|nr:ABC transporter permease [Acidobacteriota bacterium]MBV9069233.1 ABC transporter permease [Acidobacteriota bacterium]MBV9185120.1 ABC transporter permease [Acidobacteriota bacterium]
MFFTEIFRMALGSLRTNRLRSALTMLGVAIGVFSVIGVMTALSVIQGSIESGLSFLGSNIFQFAKYPVMNTRDPEEKFANRRNISLEQATEFKRLMEGQASAIALKCFDGGKPVSYGNVTLQGRTLVGTNEFFLAANSYTIAYGRNISPDDVDLGRPVTVVGASIQKKLFPSQTALGKTIKVNSKPYTIIGVLDEKGSSFGNSQDELVLVPITKFFSDFGHEHRTINLAIQSTSQATYNDTLDKAIGAMRSARGLKLGQDNDFEIYSNDTLVTAFAQVADTVRAGAFVVSVIALLAAGIGIMNIMLVSVTERTREIGVRKAIGARKYDIIKQFLIEAVLLSELGGLAGIVTGVLGGNGIALAFSMNMVFPWFWAITGLVVCSAIGIGFGSYPAWKAASLHPIEALRYE